MSNTNESVIERIYKVKMSRGIDGEIIEDVNTHTHSEIVNRAKETLAKELSLDLSDFADLEAKLVREDEGDRTYYVDKSGNTVAFTDEMQFNAAIAVLNSHGQYFEAIPMQ